MIKLGNFYLKVATDELVYVYKTDVRGTPVAYIRRDYNDATKKYYWKLIFQATFEHLRDEIEIVASSGEGRTTAKIRLWLGDWHVAVRSDVIEPIDHLTDAQKEKRAKQNAERKEAEAAKKKGA